MVNKCAAYGCTSGYENRNDCTKQQASEKITFHSFPLRNKDLCDKWTRANPRKNFTPTKFSRMCSIHFLPSDFVEERLDSNSTRQKYKTAKSNLLTKRYLKDDAVPSIFPNAPSYLSSCGSNQRKTVKVSAHDRRSAAVEQMNLIEQEFLTADSITEKSLVHIAQLLQNDETLPTGFFVNTLEEFLLIYSLETASFPIKVKASVVLQNDHTVVACVNDGVIPATQYANIVKGPVRLLSQIINLVAYIKFLCDNLHDLSFKACLQMAIDSLNLASNVVDDEGEQNHKILFIKDQLKMLSMDKFHRQYSPQSMIMSYLVYSSSATGYQTLRDKKLLSLPSVRTLQKVTRRLNSDTGLDNTEYLKLRASKLNSFEKTVILIIDEIYIAKRVEYSAGEIHGLTPEGKVATTLLCFMVKSLTSKYRDIVAMYPICSLTAIKQFECYNEVMNLLRSIELNVIAISVDNASVNRKFFTEQLCGGNLTTSIRDSVSGLPIFLIFDPVHGIKNIYNNFQSRKLFVCPPMPLNLPDGCTANFKDIVELYNLESSMPLKKAHRLSAAAMEPKSIEKTSVKLAVSVFCESTRDALRYYSTSDNKPSWSDTAEFIAVILKLWNVLNVKSQSKGKHKRDKSMDPVLSVSDWKIAFLEEFGAFLRHWEASKQPGLTRETFLAISHSCFAISDCAKYILSHLGFKFILLGQLQSDALESRFGWLRQMSGANYYISMRQVIESDKSIRMVSLLSSSQFTLLDIDAAISEEKEPNCEDDNTAESISSLLTYCCVPSTSDANIIYYVCGAIVRSIVRTTKCENCRSILVAEEGLGGSSDLVESMDNSAATFLESINRGGLLKPSDYSFSVAVHCWIIYSEIKSTDSLKSKFLSSLNHRSVFQKIIDNSHAEDLILSKFCLSSHDLKNHIVKRFFNCVAKNLVKELSCGANKHGLSGSKKRKIDKLNSV